MRPRGETVTIVRSTPGGTDQFGDVRDGVVSEHDVVTLYPVAPRTSSESNHADGVVLGLRLALPLGTDVNRDDLIRVRGVLWKVDGEIAEWRPAFGFDRRPGALDLNLVRAEVGTWR